MNKLDEHYFFLNKAISEGLFNTHRYYYDINSDELFGLIFYDIDVINPYLRNILSNNSEIINCLNKKIKLVVNKDSSIVELPRLSIDSRRNILLSVSKKFQDERIEKVISSRLEYITESKALQIEDKNGIAILGLDLSFNFSVEMTNQILNEVKKIYYPLGISEDSKILW